MNKKQMLFSAVAAVLFCIVMLPLFAFPATAASEDYSKPGGTEKTTYNSADILETVMKLELCDAERRYLELYGEYSISYGTHIPTSFVSINYDEKSKELTVIAKKYSYTAQNGAEIEFLPVSVTVGNKRISPEKFDTESFVADFGVCDAGEDSSAIVVYTTDFKISERTVNSLINKAYYDALYWQKTVVAKEKEYEEKLAEYERLDALHEEYLKSLAEYETTLALYKAYRIEKRLYEERLTAYNSYLTELRDYEEKLAEYRDYEARLQKYNEEYLLYKKYLDNKAEYETNLSLYNQYVENLKIAKEQIAIIDGVKGKSTSLSRSVYNAIIGDTVTQVIANKDAIANNTVGVKPETVDMAGDATENLRALFAAYFALENEHDKYTYYAINYDKFKTNFINLFSALDKMYENSKVKLALNEKGLKEKYEILLAQLYYVVNALSDGPVPNYDGTAYFDSTYKINKVTGATPIKILENVPYMVDTGRAEPLPSGYPSEVEKPVLTEVSEPKKPEAVSEPVAPDAVVDPGDAPVEVKEPELPEEVYDPGEAPEPYVAPKPILDIIEAYENGELGDGPRESVSEDRYITAEITVNKQIVGAETYKVEFMDTAGNHVCTAFADKGTYAEYTGPVQKKAADDAATYEFCGWVDSDGKPCDITSITSNLVLYPSFTATPKSYTVSWNVDGNITSTSVPYGELPSYSGVPQKPDFESFYYVFKGWDKEIEAVKGDVTYTAVFETKFLFTSENGSGVIVENSDGDFIINCKNSYDSSFDLSQILPRAKESGAIYINSGKYSVSIPYSDVIAMNDLGVKKLSVEQKLMLGGRYSFKVTLLDDLGSEIIPTGLTRALDSAVKVVLDLPISVSDPASLKVYCYEGEERKPVRATFSDGRLLVTCLASTVYYTAEEYAVNIIPSSPVSVSASVAAASKGDVVEITLSEIPAGVVLDSVYYLDSDGVRYEITSNEFVMIYGGVSVGVDFHYEKYTVLFVADGKIVLTQTALYGQTVKPPPAPEKASDGTYSYSFIGWTPEVSEVKGNITYVAQYMKTLLPPKEEPTGLQITPGVLRILVAAMIGVFYVVGVGVPVFVIVVVKSAVRIKRRKKRTKVSKRQ